MKLPEWHHRPEQPRQGELGVDQFLKVADQFIALANTKNRKIVATDLHFAMLYAAARYNAHVGKNVMEVLTMMRSSSICRNNMQTFCVNIWPIRRYRPC